MHINGKVGVLPAVCLTRAGLCSMGWGEWNRLLTSWAPTQWTPMQMWETAETWLVFAY